MNRTTLRGKQNRPELLVYTLIDAFDEITVPDLVCNRVFSCHVINYCFFWWVYSPADLAVTLGSKRCTIWSCLGILKDFARLMILHWDHFLMILIRDVKHGYMFENVVMMMILDPNSHPTEGQIQHNLFQKFPGGLLLSTGSDPSLHSRCVPNKGTGIDKRCRTDSIFSCSALLASNLYKIFCDKLHYRSQFLSICSCQLSQSVGCPGSGTPN